MRKKQTMLIAILGVSIVALGVGFAAFSTVLNISSSANVTPNSGDFSVVFSSSDENYVVDEVEAEVENAGASTTGTVTTTNGIIDNTTNDKPKITNLSATFTKPGQKATYTFYVHNNGKYDAYLTNIVFNNVEGSSNVKRCSAREGANPEYVRDACDGIKYNITVDNEFADTTRVVEDKLLPIDAFKTVTVEIEYESGSKRADGPFSVDFGSIELYYNTINKGVDGVPTENETYTVTGTIIDDDNNPVNGGYAAVFSTKKVVEVGSDGKFKVTGLESGDHEIYYMGNVNPIDFKKERIRTESLIKGTFNTSSSQILYSNGKRSSLKIKLEKVDNKLNVIFMIGDGMGQNHIKAGAILRSKNLYMQSISNYTDVTTNSLSGVTDSAAAATALATGYKTINGYVGKDKNGTDVENLVEYSKKLGLKAGTVSTQTIYHATPAGFTAHTSNRSDYSLIARRLFGTKDYFDSKGITYKSTTNVMIDLMIGGGKYYFDNYKPHNGTAEVDNDFINSVRSKGYTYITNFSDLNSISHDAYVIGTFSDDRTTADSYGNPKNSDPSIEAMTEKALERLENDKGFFVMIEGSDIDTYSHQSEIYNMLNELLHFDNAVKIAMNYVDKHPDTLLVITADHETGGLDLDGVTSISQLSNNLFKSKGSHTGANVMVYAYGKYANELTNHGTIDNTDIYNFVHTKLASVYE